MRLDPAIVSAYINASLFAFGTMAPWLMVSVGLQADEYESRVDEIVDVSVRLIALAAGAGAAATRPGRLRADGKNARSRPSGRRKDAPRRR